MRKFLSLLLVVIMVVSMIPTAYAVTPVCEMCGSTGDFTNPHMHVGRDGSYCVACGHCEACADNDECYCSYCNTTEVGNGTQVSFNAEADNDGDGQPDSVESYTVTVPAKLAPAGSGNVVAQGTWSSARKLVVTADKNVTLTNSINADDEKVLTVTFPGIELVGSNTTAITDTKVVSVADIEAALFGTWEGVFNYNVEMVDIVNLVNIPEGYTLCEHFPMYTQNGSYSTDDHGAAYVAINHNSHFSSSENNNLYIVFDNVGYVVEVQRGEASGSPIAVYREYGGNGALYYALTGNSEFADAPDTGEPFFFYSYDGQGSFYAAEGYEDALLTWTVYANEG